jgi:hypothetical protein
VLLSWIQLRVSEAGKNSKMKISRSKGNVTKRKSARSKEKRNSKSNSNKMSKETLIQIIFLTLRKIFNQPENEKKKAQVMSLQAR